MKELKDWTLGEIKELCMCRRSDSCDTCPLSIFCDNVGYISPDGWDLTETPQTPTIESTIVWHKYPEDKPTTLGWKLVVFSSKRNEVDFFRFNDPKGYTDITAWADFPNVPNWEGD